jgi:hypothetical protein
MDVDLREGEMSVPIGSCQSPSVLRRDEVRDQWPPTRGAAHRATIGEHDTPYPDGADPTRPAIHWCRTIALRRTRVGEHAVDVVEGDKVGRLIAHSASAEAPRTTRVCCAWNALLQGACALSARTYTRSTCRQPESEGGRGLIEFRV